MLASCLTPAALSREADRYRRMAQRAYADPPLGYTPAQWRRHCLHMAREYETRSQWGADGRTH